MVNRLVHAQSPYLQQDATNPVDWWEWGEEAMSEAARRDVPILLSVGYASCHWLSLLTTHQLVPVARCVIDWWQKEYFAPRCPLERLGPQGRPAAGFSAC